MGLEIGITYIVFVGFVDSFLGMSSGWAFYNSLSTGWQLLLSAAIAFGLILPLYLLRENTIIRLAGVYQTCVLIIFLYGGFSQADRWGKPWLLKTSLIVFSVAIAYRTIKKIRAMLADTLDNPELAEGDAPIERANAGTFIYALLINIINSLIYAMCTFWAYPKPSDAITIRRYILFGIFGVGLTVIEALLTWRFDWINRIDRRIKREQAKENKRNAQRGQTY